MELYSRKNIYFSVGSRTEGNAGGSVESDIGISLVLSEQPDKSKWLLCVFHPSGNCSCQPMPSLSSILQLQAQLAQQTDPGTLPPFSLGPWAACHNYLKTLSSPALQQFSFSWTWIFIWSKRGTSGCWEKVWVLGSGLCGSELAPGLMCRILLRNKGSSSWTCGSLYVLQAMPPGLGSFNVQLTFKTT